MIVYDLHHAKVGYQQIKTVAALAVQARSKWSDASTPTPNVGLRYIFPLYLRPVSHGSEKAGPDCFPGVYQDPRAPHGVLNSNVHGRRGTAQSFNPKEQTSAKGSANAADN